MRKVIARFFYLLALTKFGTIFGSKGLHGFLLENNYTIITIFFSFILMCKKLSFRSLQKDFAP
jgi:hypothetical protein